MHKKIWSVAVQNGDLRPTGTVFPCPSSATTLALGHRAILTLITPSTNLFKMLSDQSITEWKERKTFCLTKLCTNTALKPKFNSNCLNARPMSARRPLCNTAQVFI